MEVEERRKIGLKYLKTIDGEVGDEVIKALDGVAGDIGNYILEFAFGEIYNRQSSFARFIRAIGSGRKINSLCKCFLTKSCLFSEILNMKRTNFVHSSQHLFLTK